ncbi:E3 ubiquitin-protein ligase SIAH1B [Eurytemora carolleeae]|uniref:E3 ubiquitin-protein ligase SIAH1B n=1 Tax=Eurytemora carolleeae TaxID=1294199 RepID=UPI000C75E896|nr:E3 ubiquitin-protein ligase SIAH1B [Eurytemora carolleeae]|eukprot:XP_023347929.1 E3 ubiquitin-protein ligase SIAH1B-like [Eurytemora affinis]
MSEVNSLVEDLKKSLECPVCFNIPRKPPIFQCENGHLICAECKPRILSCPQCRKPFRGRLLFAESLLDRVPVPCRYQTEGCDLEVVCGYIEEHEARCHFGPTSCSYSEYGCTEVITRMELGKHQEICGFSPITCQVADCKKKIGKNLYLRHIQTEHSPGLQINSMNSILFFVLIISIFTNLMLYW